MGGGGEQGRGGGGGAGGKRRGKRDPRERAMKDVRGLRLVRGKCTTQRQRTVR